MTVKHTVYWKRSTATDGDSLHLPVEAVIPPEVHSHASEATLPGRTVALLFSDM